MNTPTFSKLKPIKKIFLEHRILRVFTDIKKLKKLLIISSNSILTLFDINSFSNSQDLRINNSNVIDADYLSEYCLLASIDETHNININKITMNYFGNKFKTRCKHNFKTNHLDCRILFTGNRSQVLLLSNKIELWNLCHKRCEKSYIFSYNEKIKNLALNNNNNIFIAKTNSTLYFFHKDYPDFISKLNFRSTVNQVKWITPSKFCLTTPNSSIYFYDLKNLKLPIKVLKFKKMNKILSFDIDYKNKNIIALDNRSKVTYYNMKTRSQLKYSTKLINMPLYNIFFINQGLHFITISEPKSFTIWNFQK
ncbi:hypothetical protein BNATCHR378 (nucleomorph) [Bigelowiella natans]|uniref:Uncharacterized protein n=1 Tax=Bigelowiella natans TaxID=227086 RepID=Q3LVW6_BIGNA|nr:hypothetical protein BNATCHR378 [Bigelowiella natans]ABA27399.1 histone 3 [Bigelowiella natans]|mmetsp:Transcript_11346/g.13508  ORF Transcript_11346/g.13508 Transcript_11346/m.13508 type:complete len:309 (-) Transcript_11346:364-1290(-)